MGNGILITNKLLSVFVCSLILSILPAQAEIYKWRDEHGRIHYGDRPVSKEAEEIKYKSSATPGNNSAASWQEIQERQEKFLDYLQEERKARDDKRQEQLQKLAQRKEQCKEAKAYRDELNSVPIFYRVDDQGNKEFVSVEEKEENLNKAVTFISKYCKE